MIIAFYKGFKGTITDKAICIWTFSKYSHCELLDNKGYSYSSSSRDGGVRKKQIPYNPEKWDYYTLNIKHPTKYKWLYKFYSVTEGCLYDWIGIVFSQILPLSIEDSSKYYCSEWILYFFKYILGVDFKEMQSSPGRLYRILKKKGMVKVSTKRDLERTFPKTIS